MVTLTVRVLPSRSSHLNLSGGLGLRKNGLVAYLSGYRDLFEDSNHQMIGVFSVNPTRVSIFEISTSVLRVTALPPVFLCS